MSSSQGLPKSFFFFQKFIFARWCLMGCWDADGLLKMGKMGNFSKCLIFFFYFRKAFIVVICCTMNFFSLRILDSNSAPSLFVAVVDLKQSLRKSLFVAVVDLKLSLKKFICSGCWLKTKFIKSLFVAVVDFKQSLRKSLFVAVVDLSGCRLWGGRNERVKWNNLPTKTSTWILHFFANLNFLAYLKYQFCCTFKFSIFVCKLKFKLYF